MANKKIKILLIEDNPADIASIREIISDESSTFDFEYKEKLSGGINRLKEGNIDIVLLDLSLPDSLGIGTLSKLHSEAPSVPIIVLTNLDDEIIAIDAVQEGAMDYLIKSNTDSRSLLASIKTVLNRQNKANIRL